MPNNSCPILSPEQRAFLAIREAAEKAMLETIDKAVRDAAEQTAAGLRNAGLSFEPTHPDYFAFTAQQALFARLCGADPTTFEGGNPEIGERIVRNGQHIIDHYWRKNDGGSSDEALG